MIDELEKPAEVADAPATGEGLITREQYRDNLGGLMIRDSFMFKTKNQLMKRRLNEGPKRPNWFIRWLFGRD